MKIDLKQFAHLAETFAPLILASTPLAPIAPFVAAGIQTAESFQGATSADKLNKAVTLVQQGIAATNAQAGHVEIDPQITQAAITAGVGAVVNAINLVHSFKAEDASEQAPPAPPAPAKA